MLDQLKDIQKLHSLTKVYLIGITVIAVLVSISSIWMSYQFAEAQREKIYVLDQGKSLILALEQDIRQSRPAEAKAHVQRFHELFFTLTPNISSIENNVNKALQLSDETPAFYYKERKSKQYYDHIVQGGIICEIFTDSVIVNMDKYPYEATYYGKTSFMQALI
jgi:conjugative transposon TraK protein